VDSDSLPSGTQFSRFVCHDGSEDWMPVSAYFEPSMKIPAKSSKSSSSQMSSPSTAHSKDSPFKILAVVAAGCLLLTFTEISSDSDFSPLDGSHAASVKTIKRSMKDPSSFEHVETRFNNNTVFTKFRGTNSSGATATNIIANNRDTGAVK